jgi:hypothetical protein
VKIQILHLDPHDDNVSARDKLGWAQAGRVVLVWPREGRPLTRRLDLVLVDRRARALGAQLGLVTSDPEIRQHARDLGLPVFDNPDRIPEEGWTRRRRRPLPLAQRNRAAPADWLALRPPRQARELSRPARLVVFAIPILALLTVAASLLPSAVITVWPATVARAAIFTFWLDPTAGSPRADGRVPAETVTASLRGERRVTTTGAVPIDSSSAEGEVVLTNLTFGRVEIPAETGLRATGSGNARFLTLEDVALDAGEEAVVEVRAAAPGIAGNVPAGAIDAVEGPASFLVEVTNPEPTAGGGESERPAVAAADRSRALRELTAELLGRAGAELEASLEPGQTLAMASLRTVREVERTYDRGVGEPADSLRLTLAIEVMAYVYNRDDLVTAASLAAAEHVEILDLVPGSVDLQLDGEFAETSPARYSASGVVRWQAYEPPDYSTLDRSLAGISRRQAAERISEAFDLPRLPEIRLSPPWFPWLPWLPGRISFRLAWES